MGKHEHSIVVVEDSYDDEMLVRRSLRAMGVEHSVTVFSDGHATREAFERWSPPIVPPSLVLLDMKLPGVGGLSLLDAVRKNPHLVHVPVICLSSASTRNLEQQCEHLGADFIEKAIDYQAFVSELAARSFLCLNIAET